jgi:xanthine dehydrogenase accessory factor
MHMFAEVYRTLISNLDKGINSVVLTYLKSHSTNNGEIANKVLITNDEIENKASTLPEKLHDGIVKALSSGKLGIIDTEENESVLVEPFTPKPRLIIFGGGHIAKPLCEFAARVGFAVTIIDDRPFFANTARFPEAEKVICESFEKCFEFINLNKSDFTAIITRGHRHDGTVLREVLKHELCYVGMIGSKRRVKGMMEELANEGFSEEKLSAVNSPIGLDIGAITPDEIAISIIAQLIGYKNKAFTRNSTEGYVLPEFDLDVAQKIAQEEDMPKAVLTILSSKGSVPRKAGAKMIAYLDGRTIGSIGGGCSEAEVLRKARGLMLQKGFLIEHVDMTGDVAESEGMVCGGTMEVLVEVF